MRAALDDLATHETAGRRLAVLGDMLELGPAEDEHHRDVGAYAATAGVDVLVTVGPRAARCSTPSTARATRSAPRGGRRAGRRPARARRRAARQGLARGRPRSRRRVAGGGERLMGEVLIAGTASLLICIFLSPKFISFLRRREFGQQIREEGPQEHHAKAGTPTMGGIIIFTAIAVPFLLLTDLDPRAVGVFGVARRVRAARLRRRLREARAAALARPARAHQARGDDPDRGRAVARGDASGPGCRTRSTCGSSTTRSTSGSSTRSSSTSWWRARPRP